LQLVDQRPAAITSVLATMLPWWAPTASARVLAVSRAKPSFCSWAVRIGTVIASWRSGLAAGSTKPGTATLPSNRWKPGEALPRSW
jgi:hypothetical protein